MRKILTAIDQANSNHLFWVIVASSIILAARMQAIQHGWINPDSVLYLEAAKYIAAGDFQSAYPIFPWPFYSICIATVHKLTSFPIHLSAQFLNMVFFGIATASFLKIIQLSGAKNLALFSGALLLFGNLYIVGDVLEMLMRDEGFWAFYLASLVFFIRFYKQYKTSDALLWQFSAIIALLFRIEAITFLLFLPFTFIFHQDLNVRQRLIHLLKSYSISFLALLVIFIAIYTVEALSIENFGRLQEVFNTNLWGVFTKNIIEKSSIMSEHVLGRYLEEYAIAGLLITFAYVIIVKNLTTLGLVGVVLSGVHFKNKLFYMVPSVKRVLSGAAIISIMNMMLIITKVFVLSSRYVTALTFILLIVAALYLGHLLSMIKEKKQTRLVAIISITIIIMSLSIIKNILPKRAGYNFMQQATTWINKNHPNQSVFYENSRLRYYAGEPYTGQGEFNWNSLEAHNIQVKILQYDYLVINFKMRHHHKKKMINQFLPNYKEVKRFYSTRNKKYSAIYQKQMTE